jgi:hypothetical protein
LLILSYSTFVHSQYRDIQIYSPQTQLRSARGIEIGNKLQISAAITAGIGGVLIGLGLYDINTAPSEVFPILGFGAGVVGLSCVVVSVPLFTTGTIIKTRHKNELKKSRK